MACYSTRDLTGSPVYERTPKKEHRIGKVHSAIFHPNERKVIGFTIKRPDVALMFHRSEKAMPVDAFEVQGKNLVVDEKNLMSGKALAKRFNVSWDECLMWQGMPLLTEEGERCGYVGEVIFSTEDGSVKTLSIDKGGTHNVLIGRTSISADEVKGFKLGVGEKLNSVSEDDFLQGAIIVSNEALLAEAEGGLAEKAGSASAKVANTVNKKVEKAKPAVNEATQKVGEAVNKGAYALGERLAQTKGMFSSFKEEYNKARKGSDEE